MFQKSTSIYILQFRIYILVDLKNIAKFHPKQMLVEIATHIFMKSYKFGKEMKMKYVNIDLMEDVEQLIKKIHIDKYFISFYFIFHI